MELETKARRVRIVSGDPARVEAEINELLDNYAPLVWNVQPSPGGALVTCILVHESEVRKAQLAAARQQAGVMGPQKFGF